VTHRIPHFACIPHNHEFSFDETAYSIHEAFDLEFLLAHAKCFVPVELRFPYRTIRQLHIGDALSFAPPAFAVELTQTRKLTNGSANGERFLARNLAANLKNTTGEV